MTDHSTSDHVKPRQTWASLGKLGMLAAAVTLSAAVAVSGFSNRTASANTAVTLPKDNNVAIFAGGCFWCVEADFDKVPGVISTTSGYTGGETKNPTYKQVTYTETGHYEAVAIVFDPKRVTYRELVDRFFTSVDPTDPRGQFCDKGTSYRTAIFPVTPEQERIAKAIKQKYAKSGILKKPIVTPIIKAGTFWRAEEYHQDFYTKKPIRYKFYRNGCGRDNRVQALWGDKAWTRK